MLLIAVLIGVVAVSFGIAAAVRVRRAPTGRLALGVAGIVFMGYSVGLLLPQLGLWLMAVVDLRDDTSWWLTDLSIAVIGIAGLVGAKMRLPVARRLFGASCGYDRREGT